jgi:predicted transcriptional regulator of viral defense system
MLYEYLQENYQKNEPIFLSDINLPVTQTNLRQMFKVLCDSGKIKRYDNGIYYIPAVSRLKGGTSIAPGTVVQYRYIARKGKIDGYYSGFTFANQLGLSVQVPYALEIVTNNTSSKLREINLKGQRVVLRKPRATVTDRNCHVLQLLDLLKDIDLYADDKNEATTGCIIDYIREEKITQENVDEYISLYPDKIYRNFYEMRLYNAFA